MKLKSKSKIITFIILIFVIVLSVVVHFNLSNDIEKLENNKQLQISECEKNVVNSNDESYINYCKILMSSKSIKIDFFTVFANILIFYVKFLNPLAILIVIIPSLIIPSKILKNKYIINVNNRMDYSNFRKKFFYEAYKYVWILPLIAFILILPVFFYTTFDLSYSMEYGFSYWSTSIVYHPFIFILLYLFNIFMYSVIFVNFGLMVLRKKHSYIITIILTYILYIIVQLFLELVMNLIILVPIFKTEIGYLFNIMNLFMFSDQFGIFNLLLFTFIVWVITSIIVYLLYRKKEQLVIDCEKNK